MHHELHTYMSQDSDKEQAHNCINCMDHFYRPSSQFIEQSHGLTRLSEGKIEEEGAREHQKVFRDQLANIGR